MPKIFTKRSYFCASFASSIALLSVFSCTLEPKYQTPKTKLEISNEAKKAQNSLVEWQNFFESKDLQNLIEEALKNNRDLQVANLNIEAAEANYGITKADLLPNVNAVLSQTKQGVPSTLSRFAARRQYRANLSLVSYEVDFFGRLRSLKNAALQDFMATKAARDVTKISVISQTANYYAQLLLDLELQKIAEESLEAQKEKLRISELKLKNNLISEVDFLAEKNSLMASESTLEDSIQQVELDKNALKVLIGNFDDKKISQNEKLENLKINESLLEFVPSKNLLKRPDIQQAEYNLKLANANIGAARAAFFPSISLTGTYGYSSTVMTDLFNSKSWNFTPQLNLPIFAGGRNYQNLKLANIRKKIEIVEYEQIIEKSFREVLDQAATRKSLVKQLELEKKTWNNKDIIFQTSVAKEAAGLVSKYDLMTAKITYLSARKTYLETYKTYLVNLIDFYKVLGGGAEIDEELEVESKKPAKS